MTDAYDACDDRQLGTIVLGRRYLTTMTYGQLRKARRTVKKWAEKSGLPLVLINPGNFEGEGEDDASETFYAGLLVAKAEDGEEPTVVDPASLAMSRLAQVPAGFWTALEEKHELEAGEADEEDGPSEGLYLVPAGWAVASLLLGEADFATTASEDTVAGLYLGEERLKDALGSGKPLRLQGEYC